jgi:hypothetical protein
MSIELPDLIGKEKQHYESMEELYSYSCGKKLDEKELRDKLNETIDDWDKMMGGRNTLKPSVTPYFQQLLKGDKNKARELYLFLSPIFFYIHVLFEMERKAWRNAMTSSGIFCERIVRNLIQEVDRKNSTNIWLELSKDPKFDNRNGRLLKELEAKKIAEADTIYSLLKSIYYTRSHTGPHDVPPPEPIQADLSTRLCLPAYVKYLEALMDLGNDLKNDFNNYLSFFYSLTRTDIALVFGQEEIRKTPTEIIREIYRQGFFKSGKTFGEIKARLHDAGYDFGDVRIAQQLGKLSKGSKAMLTRRGKRGFYTYNERYPPEEFFKTTF